MVRAPSGWSSAPRSRRWLGGLILAAGLGLAGCAGGVPDASPSPVASAPATPVAVPADGLLLSAFGYRNGPVAAFSLPRSATLMTAVDQPDNVSAVLSTPTPVAVYDYLTRALPSTGFTIDDRDEAASTLTFSGQGWRGSLTADGRTSAVLLRPE